jgi:hypothetical protein
LNLINEDFAIWAKGFSGCDGGDIGSPHNKSIWFCGIEYAGEDISDENELRKITFSEKVQIPFEGHTEWNHNLKHRFNWQAMKLLASINGGRVSEYKRFAEINQPFVKGANGYFKANLYPLAFKNTSHQFWKDSFAKATGLNKKQDYLEWIRINRFPIMKTWVENYCPKLIICAGRNYLGDYALAFADDGLAFNSEVIDDRELNWTINKNGSIVVVIPFMINRNGLTKNVSIQKFGDRIRELLASN